MRWAPILLQKAMTLRAKEQLAGDSAAQNRPAIRARPRNVGMNMWSIAADIDDVMWRDAVIPVR